MKPFKQKMMTVRTELVIQSKEHMVNKYVDADDKPYVDDVDKDDIDNEDECDSGIRYT